MASACVIVSVGGVSLTLRQEPVMTASVAVRSTAAEAGSSTAAGSK